MPTKSPTNTAQTGIRSATRNRTSCPNPGPQSYSKSEPAKPARQIDESAFIRRLKRTNLGPHSQIVSNAQRIGARCRTEPGELLNMAIVRGARPGVSRPDIPVAPYITMLMKSVASGINVARTRAAERGVITPVPYVAEQLPVVRSILDPHSEIVRSQEQAYFAGLIDKVAAGDPGMERLIDCLGEGMRGKALQTALGLSPIELATWRKKLKRRTKTLGKWEDLAHC